MGDIPVIKEKPVWALPVNTGDQLVMDHPPAQEPLVINKPVLVISPVMDQPVRDMDQPVTVL